MNLGSQISIRKKSTAEHSSSAQYTSAVTNPEATSVLGVTDLERLAFPNTDHGVKRGLCVGQGEVSYVADE